MGRTYPEMNERICGILRVGGSIAGKYAAERIEELERDNEHLRKENSRLQESVEGWVEAHDKLRRYVNEHDPSGV